MSGELKSSRKLHPDNTVVRIAGREIGGGKLSVVAGPCAVESEEQIYAVAEAVSLAGADFLRGGGYKPRTSPYDFQGLGADGIRLLVEAGKKFGIPVISEIVDPRDVDLFADVDVLQIGSRNMQNYSLLKEVGRSNKPVLLKRGISASYEEFLCSAEYILNEGNDKLILCERGIRSFDQHTRNVLDLTAVPVLKQLSHLPVMVDPSHATGKREYVAPMAKAAVAAGADALMIEVHTEPEKAFSDARQAISCESFAELMKNIRKIENACR